MAAVEKYTIRELEKLISNGHKFRLFKPFLFNGAVLLNVEKVLNDKDIMRLDGKVFGPIEVVQAVEHNTDNKIRNAIAENCIKILKTDPLFNPDKTHHLDFTKRKETEKFINAIIKENALLAQKLLNIYHFSKKLFIHSIHVAVISVVIELGLQQKQKIHNALRIEELLSSALLHDLGFLKLPKEMVEIKRREYDEKQNELYHTYPMHSKLIAEDMAGALRKKSILIIEQHQERLLGNGFPKGLKKDEIDPLALIIGLADEFDLLYMKETAIHDKPASELMSRISRSSKFFGTDVVDSFYTWFRYLK